MSPFNSRQGFLVSAIVHLTLLMILLSRPPAEKTKPTDDLSSARMAKVFVPPAETLRQVLPPTALRRMPRPAPTPPPAQPPSPSAKDRISIGPPIPMQQKGPLILRKEDDLTKVAKGRPDAVPSPQAPAPPVPTPEPSRTANAGSTQPKAPGAEGLRLPPGLGRDMQRGKDGSKGETNPMGPSIASQVPEFVDRQIASNESLGLASGTGQQMGPLFYDPMGADFTVWLNHMKNEFFRNWVPPPSFLVRPSANTVVRLVVERDGTLSTDELLASCHNPGLDKAVRNAFQSSLLLPLPADYRPPRFPITITIIFINEERAGS